MQNLGGYNANNLVIKRFLLHETGTYNQQYRRPYDTSNRSQITGIHQAILDKVGGSRTFDSSLFAGLAGSYIHPTAAPEKPLDLINGWNNRRMRFMLEVEFTFTSGGKGTEVILGYTDQSGVSINGAIDPTMKFYVNSIMEVRSSVAFTGFGAQQTMQAINCNHVLVNNDWTSIYDQNRDQYMRPTDVYTAMTRVQQHGLPQDGIIDARTMVNNTAVKSFRANASAPDYMSKIFSGYTQAVLQADYTDDEKTIIDKARGIGGESSAAMDPFLFAIMQTRGEGNVGNIFTFRDLENIDPNTRNVTHAQLLSPNTMKAPHHSGQTANWEGTDNTTLTATILSQTIPGLLMDLALTRVVFKSSNRDLGSTIRTAILDVEGFTNGDLSKQLARFISKLENEVLRDISFNNSIDFAIEMKVDLLGETWLSISIDGSPFYDYVTPSFCDALLTPVISSNNDRIMNLASDFQILSNDLCDRHPETIAAHKNSRFELAVPYQPGLV